METNADRPDPSEHEIIQIGAVLASADGELEEFKTAVRPRRKLAEHIIRLTGIQHGDLEHAPSLEQALPEFLSGSVTGP